MPFVKSMQRVEKVSFSTRWFLVRRYQVGLLSNYETPYPPSVLSQNRKVYHSITTPSVFRVVEMEKREY
jgi:hypothetical protein